MNYDIRLFGILISLLIHNTLFANTTNSENPLFFTNPSIDSIIIDKLLEDYKTDPYKFMNTIPQKTYEGSYERLQPFIFSADKIKNKKYIELKNEERSIVMLSKFLHNDDARLLVDNGNQMLTTLNQMEDENLVSAKLSSQPWSDAYWPYYRGNIAWRYADSKFPNSRNFIKNYNYIWLAPILEIGSSNPKRYDTLSPAEKYDLLIGDSSRSLTAAALRSGKRFYDSEKKVAYWMGICHGWAAASYMVSRPTKAVTVTAVDGRTKINFYPSDIKSLFSYLWANVNFHSRFAGGRCDKVNPKKNRYGRITDQNCFDTNPGTWHLSVVNQIGVSQRSLIMDSAYDHEVWNQPIYSYQYSYFNPNNLKSKTNLNDATIRIRDLKFDKFHEYRSPKTEYLVGVAMTLIYMTETRPTKASKDSPSADRKVKVTYLYDLELDSSGNIIGGEWYQNAHPDFLWSPDKGIRLQTKYDEDLERNEEHWDTAYPIPADWANYARRSSKGLSLPLSKILEELKGN